MLFMAWSPVRRTNAGRFEVDHPGDYATFNSSHLTDATIHRIKAVYVLVPRLALPSDFFWCPLATFRRLIWSLWDMAREGASTRPFAAFLP
jgi:hypothetical protein